MKDDTSEWTPGRAGFWEHFYDKDDGTLQRKQEEQQQHSRHGEAAGDAAGLMEHYEWFMEYDQYEACLTRCLQCLLAPPHAARPLRVLHVGCGNSDFCDHLPDTIDELLGNIRRRRLPVGGTTGVDVLNVDVCAALLARLSERYPERHYAIGNCCALTPSAALPLSSQCDLDYSGDARVEVQMTKDYVWYCAAGQPPRLRYVVPSAVDLVFDKGTADALLSAFAGEYNPNMAAYATEALRVLRPGGAFVVVSINAKEVLGSYILAATDEEEDSKCFVLQFHEVIALRHGIASSRVETLGSRYNCYGFQVTLQTIDA